MSQYQVLARRYRPQTFKEVLGQEAIVKTLKNALKSASTAHAYLFCGSRGTGKTTLARILAKALNCQSLSADMEPCNACSSCREISSGSSLDVMEIDGASHRGIDDIKQIAESVGYRPSSGNCKVYLIDEVHMLTKEAFNALLKTLEEPPPNVKFFFATTEAHKIPATILSRCQRFNLSRIPLNHIIDKLKRIAHEMQVEADDAALHRLATFAEGGLRDAESLLDQIFAFSAGKVTLQVVQDVLGVMPFEQIVALDKAAATNDLQVAFRLSHALFMQGKELSHFLEDLNAHYKAILLLKLGCDELLQDFDSQHLMALKESSKIFTQDQVITILDLIQETVQNMKSAVNPQIALEALLVKIVRIRLRIPIEAIAKRLVQFEEKIAALKELDAPQDGATPTTRPQAAKEPTQTTVKQPESAPKPQAVPVPPIGQTQAPEISDDIQKNARYDTLVQFAAVELDGTVQRKRRK